MREIKFRVWNEKGEMTYSDDESILIGLNGSLYLDTAGGLFDLLNHELMQYTGLKDKNGKEIYEGDVLGGVWGDGYIGWCDKCKSFEYFDITHVCYSCVGDVFWSEFLEDEGKHEVIGNIHENPELLEVK